jgi:D-alanine-D-alanine ligase
MGNSKQPVRVAVLAGGYSGEAEVSRRSAAMVMNHMDRSRFAPVLVHIDPDGWWVERTTDGQRVRLSMTDNTYESCDGNRAGFDVAFVMVHGTPGEDGLLQAHLQLTGLPHTTAHARAMATTFHKGWTTALLRDAGVPVAPSMECLPRDQWGDAEWREVVQRLGLPCFVKPNESGSSIGVSKVKTLHNLWPAIEAARATGSSTVLIEGMLQGREFTCGVIPDGRGGLQALPVTEILTDNEFFDYAAKYEGQSREVTPADIDEASTKRVQETAVFVYRKLHMQGMARVDMMMEEGQAPHVIEVNAVPGFSEQSIIPQQAAVAGLDKTALISRILDDALGR